MIHRDIKTQNIFIASEGRLVLGDFGIVFFRDGHDRATTTFEKVGTSYWMAPWAYKNKRLAIDQIDSTLDIFPLAKVLWPMIAGLDGFSYWRYARDENNLEQMFPDDPLMPLINRNILARCIVEEEPDCTLRAHGLLDEIDKLIVQARRPGQKPENNEPWMCRMCGRGRVSAI
jgi:serine/threonine protein kinase